MMQKNRRNTEKKCQKLKFQVTVSIRPRMIYFKKRQKSVKQQIKT